MILYLPLSRIEGKSLSHGALLSRALMMPNIEEYIYDIYNNGWSISHSGNNGVGWWYCRYTDSCAPERKVNTVLAPHPCFAGLKTCTKMKHVPRRRCRTIKFIDTFVRPVSYVYRIQRRSKVFLPVSWFISKEWLLFMYIYL